jgi:beta-ketoacyl-acyl-carrier-protein synthase II
MTLSTPVVVTGIGIVSPLGNTTESTWQALLAQKSGIATIRNFDASQFPTQIAAEVKNFTIPSHLQNKKLLRSALPFTQFALVAADEALQDAQLFPTETSSSRWGLVVGSGMLTAEFDYWSQLQQTFAKDGIIHPALLEQHKKAFVTMQDFAKTQPNAAVGLLLQQFNIRGYSTSVHTACASGGQALGLALQAMRRGDVDHMLVGGFDSMINPFGVASFCLLGALSTANEHPTSASRPFDFTRDGFVLGEGAAFLVLETKERALARGVRIYAELAGEGNSLSSYRITDSHPNGDGAIQALQGALTNANESVERIDYVNAHGTSTKMNDLSETNAIKHVLHTRAKKIPVSSTKSQTGHLIAAAGALEAAFTALSIHHSVVPMTANLTTPDPDCDLDYVIEGPRKISIRAAISNSFGFGGSNSCILMRQPE